MRLARSLHNETDVTYILHDQSDLYHCIYCMYICVLLKVQKCVIINQCINNEGNNNSLNQSADIGNIDVDFTSVIVKSL